MKKRNCVTGLLGAMLVISVPLQLQAQHTTTSAAAYGGPAEHAAMGANPWHGGGHRPAPYGYVWENYCNEAAMHEMRRMQHFMERPESYGCDEGCGEGCTGDKSCGLSANVAEYRHGRYITQPNRICEDCSYDRHESDTPQPNVPSAEPPAPPNPAAAETAAPRPIREPVYLSPLDRDPVDNDSPANARTDRTPVIRLAPVAPTPADARPEQQGEDRIPRNAIPSRG